MSRQRALAAPARLEIQSPAFSPGGRIPRVYTADGDNRSPPLSWSGLPPGTRELVLVCEDPDAPFPRPFVHWILYGLGPGTTSLPEGLALSAMPVALPGARQGRNSLHRDGYTGPATPPGHGTHHYHFQLFALDAPLTLGARPDRDELIAAMSGHVLAHGTLVGTTRADGSPGLLLENRGLRACSPPAPVDLAERAPRPIVTNSRLPPHDRSPKRLQVRNSEH